ncbi:MAG: hypothetical protein EA378_01235 [Phycisphaerales bacterium]|nr:MAG: hypothetical protein EA378_01235 [Phycisphaerales bacterium]
MGIGVTLCLAVIVMGGARGDALVASVGVVGLALLCVAGPIALHLARPAAGSARVREIERLIRELTEAVDHLSEHQALSDDARRVLNRQRERELLRRAIEEDITQEDWDAAMVLVRELAERFGYRADAEEFRARIEEARYETVQRRVDSAIAGLDALLEACQWDEARREAERICRLYPDSPRTDGLRHLVERSRETFKRDLERRFLHAAGEERIDEAMELLREMDQYLTEAEAEPLKEVARGVIGRARENLGVQFKLAVQDKAWQRAAEVGERVLADFPNTRMAEEIRGLIDGIRERAAKIPG